MKTYFYILIVVLLSLLNLPAAGQVPILILDLDENSNSAPAIETSLTNLDVEFETMTTIPTDLSQYEAIFVCLGIYSTNTVLTEAEATVLAAYLTAGGSMYMEGGDTWYFDPVTTLHPMFNILGLSDGSGDLGTINGVSDTFTDGMSFAYNGDNNWIDHLSAIAPAFDIFENQSPSYVTAVAYDAGSYKTIGASFEFGGLTDGSSPSTKDELMTTYLEFLDVNLAPEAGFIASDTIICQTDIVNFFDASTGNVVTWDWTFEGGIPATSTQQNPVVAYANPGDFDVLLEVSDGEVTSTLYMPGYIHVGQVPQTASTPTGISQLCASWGNTTYNTTAIAGASSYNWKIEPSEAGTISGSGTSATVVWASGFLGIAELSVAGVNYCGTGIFSEPLAINRYLPEVTLMLPAYVGLPEPPFELTGGTPPGGEYSGPGVSNGIFDPQAAGLGEHTITYTYTDPNLCTNSAEDVITVTQFIGINDYDDSDRFSIYPNPNQGSFTINISAMPGEKADLKLYNSLNDLVWKHSVTDMANDYAERINLMDIPAGLYYLKISGNTFDKVEKVMIRK